MPTRSLSNGPTCMLALGTDVGGNRRRLSAPSLEECRRRGTDPVLYRHRHGSRDAPCDRGGGSAVWHSGPLLARRRCLLVLSHRKVFWPDRVAQDSSQN